LRAIDARTEPDVKRAVPGGVVVIIGFSVGARLGGIDRRTPARFGVFDAAVEVSAGWVALMVLALIALFVLSGLIATRSLGRELARVVSVRGNVEAGNVIRVLCFIAGYTIVGFGVLTLLHGNLGNLLVGGAITSVVASPPNKPSATSSPGSYCCSRAPTCPVTASRSAAVRWAAPSRASSPAAA